MIMFRKYSFLVYTIVIMISLFGKAIANYNKLFFDLSIKDINGEKINLDRYKNKTVLLVNVARNCGFTKQYSGLQTLYNFFLVYLLEFLIPDQLFLLFCL